MSEEGRSRRRFPSTGITLVALPSSSSSSSTSAPSPPAKLLLEPSLASYFPPEERQQLASLFFQLQAQNHKKCLQFFANQPKHFQVWNILLYISLHHFMYCTSLSVL